MPELTALLIMLHRGLPIGLNPYTFPPDRWHPTVLPAFPSFSDLSMAEIRVTILITTHSGTVRLKEYQANMSTQPARGNAEAIGICGLFNGDCAEILPTIADGSVDLIVTSPPYNIGKAYEKRSALDTYIDFQTR
ncbi:hypothetical protein [Rhizobium leguminosarum]|uniref:hypothetical protein n=1 Tax=Rhizobium leguminosarum TaxID=384 RepID=UPI001FEF0763|nr:hypothetical protein [Rhizobium leguminosarum]